MSPDFVIEQDIKQGSEGARLCSANPEHGRLTVTGTGVELACMNIISEAEAKRLHGAGRAVAKLEGSKKFICAHVEPLNVG
jgi:hypothetical protein